VRRRAGVALAIVVIGTLAAGAQTPETTAGAVVSIWYRGTPAGTPRTEDLDLIRAQGFRGVTWSSRDLLTASELYRLASARDLQVTLRVNPVPLTATSALQPTYAADIDLTTTPPDLIVPLAWRALAHGARVISFDAGRKTGSGLEGPVTPPWLRPAQAVATQVATQVRLIEEWQPATKKVTIEAPAPAGLDLLLLSDRRSWVLVVTNMSRAKVTAVAHLPAGVPGALWVNLLDGSLLSMINGPNGPRWSLEVEGGAARVYVVNH
jgi:hypothetical protein